MKPQVVFVLGGPGAGKGTQCAKITAEFPFVHLSAGDLLREERQSPGSKYGDLIDKYIREGAIVPVEITIQLLLQAMEKQMISGKTKFLVDGFPRNKNNLDGWLAQTDGKIDALFCLYISCDETIMEQRLLERGKSSGRSDDNLESIRKRFHTYLTSTVPIIEYFESIGKLRQVDGVEEPDAVYEKIRNFFLAIDN